MTDYTKNASFTAKTGTIIEGADFDAEFDEIATAIASKEDTADKNVANGYCGLDASGLVAAARLPTTAVVTTTTNIFTAPQTFSGTDPSLLLVETDAAADNGKWGIRLLAEAFYITAWNDALSSGGNFLVVDRTGTTVDTITFTGTTIAAAGNMTVSGTLLVGGVAVLTTSSALNATNLTSGTIPDARVAAASVTQHQAALSLAATQLTSGSIPDARVPASNVTQHQASLAIVADQVSCAIRDVAGTTDSPTSTDEEDIITLSSASPTTVTLNSGVCAVGNSIAFIRLGAGTVTFAAGASQTIRSPGSRLTIPEQYATVVATYIATNTWCLTGV